MLTFSIYPENGNKCVLYGEDVLSVISANQKIVLHYLGNKTRVRKYDIINTGKSEIQKYKIMVQYVKYKHYTDEDREARNMILWVDEIPYVKMPWEK